MNWFCNATLWAIISGTWRFNTTDDTNCRLISDEPGDGSVIWIDFPEALSWNKYLITLTMKKTDFEQGHGGLLFRSKTVSPINNGGQQYNIGIRSSGTIIFGKINNGWTQLYNKKVITNTNTTFDPSSNYFNLSVMANKNSFDIFINDIWQFHYVDILNPIFWNGSIGIRGWYSTNIYKSLIIDFNATRITIDYGTNTATKQEINALIDIYNKTNGENGWINKWNTNVIYSMKYNNICNKLHGIYCTKYGNDTTITHLVLPWNNLSGYIPWKALCNLYNLQYLILSNNDLLGTIDECIGHNLTNLYELRLDSNELYGSLPITIIQLQRLRTFAISKNKLYSVNTNVFYILSKLVNIEQILIDDNLFNGTAFTNVSNFNHLINLWSFNCSYNQLNGKIHNESFSKRGVLTELYMGNNYFTGSIPESLCDISVLRFVNIINNELTGSIPVCLLKSNSLQYLILSNNKLYGTIKSFEASNIIVLALSNNKFYGTFPSFNHTTKLRELFLHENNFDGILSKIFIDYKVINALQYIVLHNNNFQDNDISNLLQYWLTSKNMSSLEILTISNNKRISGHLPIVSSNKPIYQNNLLYFVAHSCDLSGSISQHLHFTNLKYLTLFNNRISCELPSNLLAPASNQTINHSTSLLLQSNLFSCPQKDNIPNWLIETSPFYSALSLYIDNNDKLHSIVIAIFAFIFLGILLIRFVVYRIKNFKKIKIKHLKIYKTKIKKKK
eukprot:338691_1